jgi:hypothetical protein
VPRILLSLIVLCIVSFGSTALCQQEPPPFRIGFTGDLMGFYRTDAPYGLPNDLRTKTKAEMDRGNFILVGMGSNFGPEYGAALQLPASGHCHIPADPTTFIGGDLNSTPEKFYKGLANDGTDRIAPEADCDNVALYLRSIGYSAVTPGHYDLIYGSVWLRDMALKLRNAGGQPQLRLLAANLIATPQSKPSKDAKSPCPPLFSASGPNDDPQATAWPFAKPGCDTKKVDAIRQNGAGYTVVQVVNPQGSTKTVLVIGVVSTDLLDSVAFRHREFCTAHGLCGIAQTVAAKDAILDILSLNLQHDFTIVMAQMPPAESEQLSISLGNKLDSANSVVLSEANSDLTTEDGERISTLQPSHARVLTARPAISRNGSGVSPFVNPLSVATPTLSASGYSLAVTNNPAPIQMTGVNPAQQLARALNCSPQTCLDLKKYILQQFVKPRGALHGGLDARADFSYLEDGDFFLDVLPDGYDPTSVCVPQLTDDIDRCKRMVWLDTVLWRGDFMRKVAVTGKELKAMLAASKTADPSQKLLHFGIDGCMGLDSYCINGRLVNDEDTYWAATSDDLAEGNKLYPVSAGANGGILSMQEQREGFVSTEIAKDFPAPYILGEQQNLGRFQVDIGKIYAGYAGLWVDGGDTQAADFKGVEEKTASATSYRNVDLEGQIRSFYRFGVKRLELGVGGQGAAAFATTRVGNVLTHDQSTTWLQDTAQGGPFGQINLTRLFNVKSALVNSVMLTVGWSRLGDIVPSTIPVSVTDPSSNKVVKEVHLPKRYTSAWKFGLRAEAGTSPKHWYQLAQGAYVDAGVQWTKTDNLLTGMQLTGHTDPCTLSASTSLADCIKNDKPTTGTGFTPMTGRSSARGPYWDVNLVWKPQAILAFTVASANGYANLWNVPTDAPASQALFSIPLSLSLDVKLTSNLTIGPAWKQYFFRLRRPITGDSGPVGSVRNQTAIFVVRWYFSRRTGVPAWRQLGVSGPVSVDQTKAVQGNAK